MFIYFKEIIHIFRLMKEKRHVYFGGALAKGNKLKYLTMTFLFVKETPISSCSRKNQKNFNNIRVEKPPVDYYAGMTFP